MKPGRPSPATDRDKARELGLHGLLCNFDQVADEPWVAKLIAWEEEQRQVRSLHRRRQAARLPRCKAMANFDWTWPKHVPRADVEALMDMQFVKEATNVVFIGPNGVGKTMLACSLASKALQAGYSVLYTHASEMLNTLASCDSAIALQRRLRALARPDVLVIDELGYLSFDNRYADLLFQVVSQRYERKCIVLTTNKEFKSWGDVFPNATSVVTLLDRLTHHSEIIVIEGASYRLKEAQERLSKRTRGRRPESANASTAPVPAPPADAS